jgi:hypothetical protein
VQGSMVDWKSIKYKQVLQKKKAGAEVCNRHHSKILEL